MNLNANRSRFYDFAKSYDIAVMTRLMKEVDSFVLLTAQMKDVLPVGDKPCAVIEGIVTAEELKAQHAEKEADGLVRVVYTGKLSEKFGVKHLIDAFCMLEDPSYRLILCGRGDCEAYIAEKSAVDSRICYQGQVTAAEAKQWTAKADVLVNPRRNDEEYTKYSFPSKNVEYLLSSNPVVAYMLDGMPETYRSFMTIVPDDRTESLAQAIAMADPVLALQKYHSFHSYAGEKLTAKAVAKTILRLSGMI